MNLSERQQQVLRLLSQGKSNKEIAFELGITEGTVKQHLFTLYKKLGATNRAKAVIAAAVQLGHVRTPDSDGTLAGGAPEAPHYVWRMVTTVVIQPAHAANASASERARFNQQMDALQAEAHLLTDGLDGLLSVIPGSGLLACFGIPQNHLDDPARAIFLTARLHAWLCANDVLHASMGIATAAEVVADNARVLYRAESIDMARTLASAATPGQVLVSEITCRLAGPVARYSAPRTASGLALSHRELLVNEAVDVKALAAKAPLPFLPEMLAPLRKPTAMWVAVEGWPPHSSVRLQDAIAIALQAQNIPTYRLRLPTQATPERTSRCAYTQLNLLARLRQRPDDNEIFLRALDSASQQLLASIRVLSMRGPLALIFQGINTHAALQQLFGETGLQQLESYPVIFVTSVLTEGQGQGSHIAARLIGPRPDAPAGGKTYRLAMPTPPMAPQGLHADLATLIDTLSPAARKLIRRLATEGSLPVREAAPLAQEVITTGLFCIADERLGCRDDTVRETLGAFYVNDGA
jgi:DNA-binding CsgD family transcriptional regulator